MLSLDRSFAWFSLFIDIGTLSEKLEIITRTREQRNIVFTILTELCIIIRDPVPARQLALHSPVSSDRSYLSLRDAIAAPLSVAPDLASSPAKTKTNDKNTDW